MIARPSPIRTILAGAASNELRSTQQRTKFRISPLLSLAWTSTESGDQGTADDCEYRACWYILTKKEAKNG